MTVHVKVNGKEYQTEDHNKPFVTLELSEEAATALQYVLGCVRGGYNKSKHTTAIYYALSDNGVNINDYDRVIEGNITFKV